MSEHLDHIHELIEIEDAFLSEVYEQLCDLDEAKEGNQALAKIYAGLYKAYEKADQAMSSLEKLHDDISDLLEGKRVKAFSQMPAHRREAIAAYAVSVAHTRKPSLVYNLYAGKNLRRFLEREAAAVLMDKHLSDEDVLVYQEHLAVSMPSMVGGQAGSCNCSDEDPKTNWGERFLWASGGAVLKGVWDHYQAKKAEKAEAKAVEG